MSGIKSKYKSLYWQQFMLTAGLVLLTMVLRLVPSLVRKAQTLLGSRTSIGKGIGRAGNKKENLRNGGAILSALTDWALEGSIVTADSMRSRGYGTAKRTSFVRYRMSLRDWVLMVVILALAGTVLWKGGFDAEFTPEIILSPVNWGIGAYSILLALPVILQGKEALQWRILRSKI